MEIYFVIVIAIKLLEKISYLLNFRLKPQSLRKFRPRSEIMDQTNLHCPGELLQCHKTIAVAVKNFKSLVQLVIFNGIVFIHFHRLREVFENKI